MPEYEYFCRDCRKTFTVLLSMREHDKKPAPCPKCKSARNVSKQLSDVSVVTTRKS